ncbi:hypothetical protein [Rheinheimera sp.]|uniref:hypothetical protein n=1 Tax=Rheinheimera sp. TaxID=1869214 RepID=UPI003D28AE36
MRNIICLILLPLLLLSGFALQANTEDQWSEERCAQLSQSDPAAQQLRQQHCAETVAAPANVMPVQLDVQLDKPAAVTEAPVPVQRVQHNSTLETLGSAMLLVLVGFWLWMGRK